jgi:hypothetical protein
VRSGRAILLAIGNTAPTPATARITLNPAAANLDRVPLAARDAVTSAPLALSGDQLDLEMTGNSWRLAAIEANSASPKYGLEEPPPPLFAFDSHPPRIRDEPQSF